MTADTTIRSIVQDDLCTGCGTCAGICPQDALRMVIDERRGIFIPVLEENLCKQCGLCYKVCPGHEVDFKFLNDRIFKKQPENVLLGNFIQCCTGYAAEHGIRYNSSSGGLVTALLIFALEEGFIDGALVTRMRRDRPLEPEPFIARTREEILEASRSKYCPVPANLAVKEMLDAPEGEKFAIVGLPCHLHGIRKAQEVHKALQKKVSLCLGLVCNHAPTFKATEFLLQRYGVQKGDVKELSYRGNGWPGGLRIVTRDNRVITDIVHDYWTAGFGTYFYANRCLFCPDQTCELADISFADAWLPEYAKDTSGRSLAIVRTQAGAFLLNAAGDAHALELTAVDCSRMIYSQGRMISERKKLGSRALLSRVTRTRMPEYNTVPVRSNFVDFLKILKLYIQMKIATRIWLWRYIEAEGRMKISIIRGVRRHNRLLNLYYNHIK